MAIYMFHDECKYELVEEFPEGYLVWNIGTELAPIDYIPLCKLRKDQPCEGGRTIEADTLKALYVGGVYGGNAIWYKIMKSAGREEIDRDKFNDLYLKFKREQEEIANMPESALPF